jgi:hypothetical protein
MLGRTVTTVFALLLNVGVGFCAPGGTNEAAAAVDVDHLTVPSGTLLRVEVTQRSRLRKGNLMQGRLLEPIYADNRLLVPSGAVVRGKIVDLLPATRGKQWEAKFHGDFTRLREPVIEWTTLTRGDGEQFAVEGESTTGPGGTLYFRTAPPQHVSRIRRAWDSFLGRKNMAVGSVRAPRKSERLKKYFWSQMPLHPQYVEEGAQYEMSLTDELRLPAGAAPALTLSAEPRPMPELMWVHSRLCAEVSSDTAKVGDPVEAVVTQPIFNAQGQLVVPQYSILHGKVVSTTASRRFGHDGALRFTFNKMTLPTGFEQQVAGTPLALESNAANHLSLDQEGGVTPRAERGVAAPLVMGLMSASAMGDEDGGAFKATASSNGFAIMGRLIALGTSSPFVGGTIGAMGTGRTIYHRWLAHGKQMEFGPDTEVVVEMTPARANRIEAGK